LIPGQNGTVYDAGTVTVNITGFTATPRNYTANYSQGSTTNSVASAIAGAINADTIAPVTASVAAGSNVVTLTSKTVGSDTNYGVTASSATSQGAYFSQPSFSGSGTALSGGTDYTTSFTTPLSTFSSYDAVGHLLQVKQGQQTRTYAYDSLGRMTSACVPERNNQCTTYTYKDFGAAATKLDPRSITSTYGYDNLARLQTITYSDGTPTVTYTYGAPGASNFAAGRLTNVSSSSVSEAYTYDNMGRITKCVKTIAGQSYTISYHYVSGQLDYSTYPSGRIVYQDHDAIGRLSQVRTGGTTVLSIGSFNAAGEVLTTTYGNGMTAAYTYNNQLQLASIVAAPVLNLSYSYGGAGDNGQIAGITDGINAARSTSYVYDELGRLKVAQTNDLTSANTWKLKFSYDRYGNRLSEIPSAGTASMPLNEVAVDATTNRLTNLVYDADGNMINDNFHTYAYNALNQITSVDGANNTYSYDASGLRVNKNGTVYIYSGGQLVAEYANGGVATSPNVEYVYAGGSRVAKIVSGAITYVYRDHLSPRAEADSSATITRTSSHFPFGETWYETGAANRWRFTTYEHDSESGLDYANARFDSTSQGRFTSLDPLSGSIGNPQSLNRYAYVMDDPINFADPTGTHCDNSTGGCYSGSNWSCLLDEHGDCVGGNTGGSSCYADGQAVGCGFVDALLRLGGVDIGYLPGINGFVRNTDQFGLQVFVQFPGPVQLYETDEQGINDMPHYLLRMVVGGAWVTISNTSDLGLDYSKLLFSIVYNPYNVFALPTGPQTIGCAGTRCPVPLPSGGQVLACIFGADPEIFAGQDAMHIPETHLQESASAAYLNNNAAPANEAPSKVQVNAQGVARGNGVGGGAAIAGNAANCVMAH
jgi:RHS repeat-associated protein